MIETQRLLIRPFNHEDIKTLMEWFFDQEVMKWIPNGPDKTQQDFETRIVKYIQHFEQYGFSKYLLLDKTNHEKIGDAGILRLDNTDMVELGYRIKKEKWRKGYATEACLAIIHHSFLKHKFHCIHAIVEQENKISIHILKNKLGFEFIKEGQYYGEIFDLYGLYYNTFKNTQQTAPLRPRKRDG